MKRRIFAAVLSAAMVLSLASCGSGNKGGSSSSNPGSSSSTNSSQPGSSSSAPDASQPDSSGTGSSSSGVSSPEDPDVSAGDIKPLPTVTLTLNKTDVSLKKAGATFQLRYTAEPDTDGAAAFTSNKPEVATVAEDGTVTAVAPGQATITVEYDGAKATCIVRCRWEEASNGGSSSSGSSGSSSASKVDLQAFYDTTIGKYEFGFLELADSSLLDQMYAGLTGVSTEQMLVYIIMMSMNNGEFGLVQVKDSKDVDTVKGILQARVSYMAGDGESPGGAWYPEPTEQWTSNARVVTNGNFVMMVVGTDCDAIVEDFNALF